VSKTTTHDSSDRPGWMTITLLAATTYNLIWGGLVVLFPNAFFRWTGMELPLYPAVWQCVGMICGVFGVGYAIAASAPLRHWPIVLVGLLGKVFGTIGFLWAASSGQLPWEFGLTIITNDVIWVVPFALILSATFRTWRLEPGRGVYEQAADVLLDTVQTNTGETLAQMSYRSPVLVAFLRHTGCPFCKEAAADLARDKAVFDAMGVELVLVHMGDEQAGKRFFESYGLADTPHISDPDRTLYRALKLQRGNLRELFGPRVWGRAVAAATQGHWMGALHGDSFQMPGLFLIRNGRIKRAFCYETAADRPDYTEFVCGIGDRVEAEQSAHAETLENCSGPT
jgi:peroxiredoxin